MKKLVNILCVFMMLAVAGTASAAVLVVKTEGEPTQYIYDPSVSSGTELIYIQKERGSGETQRERMKRERLQYDLECEALQHGMSVEKYVYEKLKKIQ